MKNTSLTLSKRLALLIATVGPFGYAPFASGTVGSMAAVPIAVLLSFLDWRAQAASLVLIYFISVWAAGVAEKHFGREDPREVVCDEVIGYLLAFFAFPPDATHLVLAFILFRAFDIIKPPPIGWVDKNVGGGWGIVSDDALAGIFSQIVLRIVL